MTSEKPRIIYMGTPDFAVAPLEMLLQHDCNVVGVVTVADKPAGRGRKLHQSAVKVFADLHGLLVLQPEKLRDSEFITQLNNLQPDIIVVVAFKMLPEVVWKQAKLGTFNLHASLLPQYRGAAPINWAIINGEKETGVTTFLIDDKIDTGQILLQEKVTIEPLETSGELHDRLMRIGAQLVVKTVESISSGSLLPKPQQEKHTLKSAPKLYRETCQIDWKISGAEIQQLILGLSPYPGAYANVESEELNGPVKILKAKFEKINTNKELGTGFIVGKQLFVAVVGGQLEVLVLQPQGKRAMNSTDFLNGLRNKDQIFRFS